MTKYVHAFVALLIPAFCWPVQAGAIHVIVDTSPLQGSSGFLAFDFVAGSPVPNNTVSITSFVSDGALGVASASGSTSGTLVPGPLDLADSSFFNEWLQGLTYGSMLSFDLAPTGNTFLGGTPDSFSFFLLDGGQTPYTTSDPTGANALFAVDLNGSDTKPDVFSSTFGSAALQAPTQIPEPGFAGLIALICVLGFLWNRYTADR